MEYNHRIQQRSWINRVSNAQGGIFEQQIEKACEYYIEKKIAYIEKTPEPFKVLKKEKDGTFTGRLGKKAQPDFKGTLCDGRSIVFEAKDTAKDRILQNRLTVEQQYSLELHSSMGGIAGVVVSMMGEFFFIPWVVWRDMKNIYGRKYIKNCDVQKYKVQYKYGVMFLDILMKKSTEQ